MFARSHLLRGAMVACAVTTVWSSVAVAQPPTFPNPADVAAGSATRGVLVLRDGSLVTGQIQKLETGYFVDLPWGRQFVPGARVLVAARDKQEAYRKQRDAMRRPTPTLHVALARWCLTYGMPTEAKEQVEAALELADDFKPAEDLDALLEVATDEKSARDLLRQIERREDHGPARVATPPVRRPPVTTPAPANGALVLVGGTLVEGRVSETATGYFVDLPKGRYLIPFERVLVAAKDRDEAYLKQRNTIRPPSPSRHFELAQWCLRYQMAEQAKEELRSALKLAGNYAPARDLLRDIERLENPEDPAHLRPDAAAVKTADGFDVPDSVSIAGLSPEVAETFTTRIQPLLVNSCGNASCHGSRGESGFELQHVRFGRGGIRVKTQQNLAAVLAHVDRERPLSSPLLAKPSAVHGGGRRPVFDGRGGRRQRDLLESWIVAAAADLQPLPKTETASAAPRPPRRVPWDPRPRPRPRPQPQTRDDEPAAPRKPDLLDRILDEERPDAFDPDAFNRSVESGRARPKPSSAGPS